MSNPALSRKTVWTLSLSPKGAEGRLISVGIFSSQDSLREYMRAHVNCTTAECSTMEDRFEFTSFYAKEVPLDDKDHTAGTPGIQILPSNYEAEKQSWTKRRAEFMQKRAESNAKLFKGGRY